MSGEINELTSMLNQITKVYWSIMWELIDKAELPDSYYKAFLHNPDELQITIGTTHIVIEYLGVESKEQLDRSFSLNVDYSDYSNGDTLDILEHISGFKNDSTSPVVSPLSGIVEGLVVPTNRGLEKLIDLHWNFDSLIELISINGKFVIEEGEFARLINCVFFDEKDGYLHTRRVIWADFIPITIDTGSDDVYDILKFDLRYYYNNVVNDLMYQFPKPIDQKDIRIEKMNRFIELIGSANVRETDITSFLNRPEYQFILSMSFFAKKIYSEVNCTWQSEDRDDIRPDFFVTSPNGYSDIVEFKLPNVKSKTVVGKTNRETFSAELNSYVSQTRVYSTYFDDPNNRIWLEKEHGIQVRRPKRILVVGRRHSFTSSEWKDIENDYNNLQLFTYDDIIDGVFAQLYF